MAGATIGLVLVILHGVAARQLAQEWASAAPREKATALCLVHVNETLNFAFASLFNSVFAAVTFILFGLAVVLSGVYPRWLGCGGGTPRDPLRDPGPGLQVLRSFDEVLRYEGVKIVKTPIRAPRANAHAERWIRTARAECLDWILVLGRRHLERVLRTYAAHCNRARPHLGARAQDAGAAARSGSVACRRRPRPDARHAGRADP